MPNLIPFRVETVRDRIIYDVGYCMDMAIRADVTIGNRHSWENHWLNLALEAESFGGWVQINNDGTHCKPTPL